MKKTKSQKELEKEPYYNIKEKDIGKEIHFKIDESSFRGPFICHGKKTGLVNKKTTLGDVSFSYPIWQCNKCKKEYLDFEQAKKFEKFLIFRKFLEDKLIAMERSMNFDGKAFFFRFPKELTRDVSKNDLVDIKLLSPEGRIFLVEIKSGKTKE